MTAADLARACDTLAALVRRGHAPCFGQGRVFDRFCRPNDALGFALAHAGWTPTAEHRDLGATSLVCAALGVKRVSIRVAFAIGQLVLDNPDRTAAELAGNLVRLGNTLRAMRDSPENASQHGVHPNQPAAEA